MNIINQILKYNPNNTPDPSKHRCVAIIASAGSGTRMGTDTTKQFLSLRGKGIAERTLETFENCGAICGIVVVAKEDETDAFGELISRRGFKKILSVVPGGDTRQKSVLAGLRACPDDTEYIVIHDAARCLVTDEIITDVTAAAIKYNAAVAAKPAEDSLHKESGGFAVSTLDRSRIWQAATPQAFKIELYRLAAYKAERDSLTVTDDVALAEEAGFKVRLVDCGSENIKITRQSDLISAEAILDSRK